MTMLSRLMRRTLEQPMLLRGDTVACPACEDTFRKFVSGPDGRPNAQCPSCGSLERQRVLWLFLQRQTKLLNEPARVLHFAPEPFLSTHLRRIHGSRYVSGDLDGSLAMETIDITDINRPSGVFDAVIVSHVLEHVPSDVQAMREIKRVLAPGGMAILQHPIDFDRESTFEDFSVVNPEERKRLFGQVDHVRLYGRDFDDRLAESGLSIEHFTITRIASEAELLRLRLGDPDTSRRGSDVYCCH
jgi:SAM-dependent methyltransferase